VERLDLDGPMVDAIRGQGNVGLPNFHYVLYEKGQQWDGKIHMLDKRTALMFE
jgi:hypothetical protein